MRHGGGARVGQALRGGNVDRIVACFLDAHSSLHAAADVRAVRDRLTGSSTQLTTARIERNQISFSFFFTPLFSNIITNSVFVF